ncbi:MAG: hypothetical protein U0Y10_22715 [Spirosomataceae bacterium]
MKLQNGHIIIPSAIVQEVLNSENQINYVYYPERRQLLLAAKSKHFFEQLHATQWTILKDKNLQGDKSWFVREILIDHELDDTDRTLMYEIKTTGIISIDL